jgi:LPS-assembly lipoprotein
MRNAMLFHLQGGNGPLSPTHALRIQVSAGIATVWVDPLTARSENGTQIVNASYSLVELATNKPVLTATAFARATFDVPGQEQRFARARAQRDAENRAAKVIAEQIRARLASYFVAGTG